MKISISAQTFDLDNYILLDVWEGGTSYQDLTRRVNKTATLDGGIVIQDNGFSHGDRIMTFQAEITQTQWDVLYALLKNYEVLTLTTPDGAYQGSMELSNNFGIVTIKFQVESNLSEWTPPTTTTTSSTTTSCTSSCSSTTCSTTTQTSSCSSTSSHTTVCSTCTSTHTTSCTSTQTSSCSSTCSTSSCSSSCSTQSSESTVSSTSTSSTSETTTASSVSSHSTTSSTSTALTTSCSSTCSTISSISTQSSSCSTVSTESTLSTSSSTQTSSCTSTCTSTQTSSCSSSSTETTQSSSCSTVSSTSSCSSTISSNSTVSTQSSTSSSCSTISTASSTSTHTTTSTTAPAPTEGTFYPSASGDDWVYNATSFDSNDTDNDIGRDGGGTWKWSWGCVFKNVTIPQGATIDTAKVTITAGDSDAVTTVNLGIWGEDEDDATAPTSQAEAAAINKTAASVAWSGVAAWTLDNTYDTPEIKTIIQEIVDRGGWNSGNDMQILILENGSSNGAWRNFSNIDRGDGYKAALYVDWS